MNRKELCEMIDNLIKTDDNFLNNKTRLYWEYVLSLGKEYVESITSDLYEECDKFLKLSSNEELEKQFIKSYESNLARKGKEICEEVEPFANNEFLIKKANFYCQTIFRLKDVQQKLIDKCNDYIDETYNFYYYKNTFDKNNDRREICREARECE